MQKLPRIWTFSTPFRNECSARLAKSSIQKGWRTAKNGPCHSRESFLPAQHRCWGILGHQISISSAELIKRQNSSEARGKAALVVSVVISRDVAPGRQRAAVPAHRPLYYIHWSVPVSIEMSVRYCARRNAASQMRQSTAAAVASGERALRQGPRGVALRSGRRRRIIAWSKKQQKLRGVQRVKKEECTRALPISTMDICGMCTHKRATQRRVLSSSVHIHPLSLLMSAQLLSNTALIKAQTLAD